MYGTSGRLILLRERETAEEECSKRRSAALSEMD
jgi:hypothetical protein